MLINPFKTQPTTRHFRAGIFLAAITALSMGVCHAENDKSDIESKSEYSTKAKAWYEGAKKKIDAEVEAGKMTQEQADKKLAYLREMIAKKAKQGAGKKPTKVDLKKQIEAAVKAGKLTREEADRKLKYLKNKGGKNKYAWITNDPYLTAGIAGIKKRLAADVEAGKLTKEDAAKKLHYYMELMKRSK